jgi:hypothetical protein
MNIYCGNNKLFRGLINGTHIQGNKYDCMRKGFGVGYNMDIDDSYRELWKPIKTDKQFFCGRNRHPTKRSGTNLECFRKGMKVGKNKRITDTFPLEVRVKRKLLSLNVATLRTICRDMNFRGYSRLRKNELVVFIYDRWRQQNFNIDGY